ncbi:MAG: hypothetical protein UW46_C0001G0031 [Candidatus Yanofskybacteria bacterium GW2011_GWF1_44_227]|uniref:Uncharacterized protein n=1 Tax=Candidatus Yanofskybacteria bacterium GW2011_GWE2_40_11 TaxID=1619033 RepID=A0A0G0T152_9BACT|nr:MAG: hypothetical protein UT69_C0012G0019 [Candidatus Yanofskybacteria bacterium GW2011_GWE1_40_10]KKR40830.1 MAG: hypothetical protein UT75_C0004G0041 [Candidatus Yanofskybacteria bacterium GW2011_GWE2_40_11]KKT15945.1 MAG: hypothetical protein UV97_C0001G0118 [Candidatus Yanofskybacteria bacterium GW2011_GWF2_43_596]KKT53541.1 MAG: hypothetical protein UW46_C0001G0031 [Candidatus Yanofskybacteria bacterium GW2011_GWF1_44_227]OGN36066.1 MAG: hypothetical protein A2207_03345 [Candidatus Yano
MTFYSDRTKYFLLILFYKMEPYLKDRFTELLDKNILDRTIWNLCESGAFPSWLRAEMSFDTLYGRLNGLRLFLTNAVLNLWIGRNGTTMNYYFHDISDEELAKMWAEKVGQVSEEMQCMSFEFNYELRKLAG